MALNVGDRRATLNPARFDLQALLTKLDEMFRVQTNTKGLELSFDCRRT